MESTPRKLRKRNGPQGIQKSNASHDRRTGTIACQSCHIRKRRCVYTAQHHRCLNCLQEDYSCVPRGHVMRAIEEEYEERAPEDSHQTFNLPLPRGIDHEVPRWAAVYSMFQEVLHFLPPEDNISDQHENINVPESDESHLNMGAPERVAAQLSSNSTINAQGDTKHPASALESAPELPIHTLSPPCLGSDSAINEGFGLMGYSNSGEGLDLDDIDALLSF